MKKINRYLQALVDRQLAPSALKVALVVVSILFVINHGAAVVKGNMTRGRADRFRKCLWTQSDGECRSRCSS